MHSPDLEAAALFTQPHESRGCGCRHVEACDELHMSAASLQCLRDAPRLAATVVIRDSSMEQLPAFLDGLPPATRLTAKPPAK